MDFTFSSAWIPASAGMTTKNHAFLMFVSPAKAEVQFGAFKRENPLTDGALTIRDSLVRRKKKVQALSTPRLQNSVNMSTNPQVSI
jgi:hypothetical protein